MNMNISKWAVSSNDATSRLRRLEGAYPKTTHTTPVFSKAKFTLPSNTAVTPTGLINSQSAVSAKGSLSPNVLSGVLGFTATTTTITLWWDGSNHSQILSVKRADGTSFTIPPGTQTVTGLIAGTQYGFSVYWNINSSSGLSFGPGDSGTPQIAISPTASPTVLNVALQAQQSYKAEPIYSGQVYFTTPASGTGTGPGTSSTGGPLSSTRPRGFSTL
jgi:hypothetical protein